MNRNEGNTATLLAGKDACQKLVQHFSKPRLILQWLEQKVHAA